MIRALVEILSLVLVFTTAHGIERKPGALSRLRRGLLLGIGALLTQLLVLAHRQERT